MAAVLLLTGCVASGTANRPASSATVESQSAAPSLEGLPKNADGYVDISVEQLTGALPDKDFTLVNVHVPYEGELPQTDLMIPYDKIEQQVNELPGKDAPIVLYCRSGSMSTTAARDLVRLGYTNVMELDGGMVAWESAGNQLQFRK
jgi:rhodanese-related sulfurtransferase